MEIKLLILFRSAEIKGNLSPESIPRPWPGCSFQAGPHTVGVISPRDGRQGSDEGRAGERGREEDLGKERESDGCRTGLLEQF